MTNGGRAGTRRGRRTNATTPPSGQSRSDSWSKDWETSLEKSETLRNAWTKWHADFSAGGGQPLEASQGWFSNTKDAPVCGPRRTGAHVPHPPPVKHITTYFWREEDAPAAINYDPNPAEIAVGPGFSTYGLIPKPPVTKRQATLGNFSLIPYQRKVNFFQRNLNYLLWKENIDFSVIRDLGRDHEYIIPILDTWTENNLHLFDQYLCCLMHHRKYVEETDARLRQLIRAQREQPGQTEDEGVSLAGFRAERHEISKLIKALQSWDLRSDAEELWKACGKMYWCRIKLFISFNPHLLGIDIAKDMWTRIFKDGLPVEDAPGIEAAHALKSLISDPVESDMPPYFLDPRLLPLRHPEVWRSNVEPLLTSMWYLEINMDAVQAAIRSGYKFNIQFSGQRKRRRRRHFWYQLEEELSSDQLAARHSARKSLVRAIPPIIQGGPPYYDIDMKDWTAAIDAGKDGWAGSVGLWFTKTPPKSQRVGHARTPKSSLGHSPSLGHSQGTFFSLPSAIRRGLSRGSHTVPLDMTPLT